MRPVWMLIIIYHHHHLLYPKAFFVARKTEFCYLRLTILFCVVINSLPKHFLSGIFIYLSISFGNLIMMWEVTGHGKTDLVVKITVCYFSLRVFLSINTQEFLILVFFLLPRKLEFAITIFKVGELLLRCTAYNF